MTVQRHGFVVDLVPGKRQEYLELHAAVWPQVEARLTASHITNYTIFLLEDTLFAYWEYTGEDYEADLALIDADPVSRRWWTFTDPCQRAWGEHAAPGDRWRELTEIWHLP